MQYSVVQCSAVPLRARTVLVPSSLHLYPEPWQPLPGRECQGTALLCTVFYIAELLCTVLYTAELHCIVLYNAELHCIALYNAELYCFVLYNVEQSQVTCDPWLCSPAI